jgi:ACS family glucarate transporter-like MFS transporter
MDLRWRIVAILCAVGFVLYIDRVNITVAVPWIALDYGFSHPEMGTILSAFLFGYAAGLIPGGWLADRLGPHRVLAVAGVAWATMTVTIACIPHHSPIQGVPVVALFALVRFLLGLCEACAFPTFNRAVANWMLPGERARSMGLIHGVSALGGAFTPVFIVFLISSVGWRASFWASAILTLMVTVWWFRYAANQPSEHKHISEPELQLLSTNRRSSHLESPDRVWYNRLLRSRDAYLLCLSEVFYGLAIFVFVTWFYTYFVEVRRAGPLYAAVLSSLPYIAMAIGAPIGGLLSDYTVGRWGAPWGRRIVPLFALVISGICGILAPSIENNAGSAVVFALAAGLQYVAAGPFWATVIDLTRRGSGLLGGAMNGAGNLGQAIGTIAFPWTVSQLGWQKGLQLAAASSIVSGIVWLFIDSSRPIDEIVAAPQNPEV